jgi:hypothetical protein
MVKRKICEDILSKFYTDKILINNNLNPDELLCLFAYNYDIAMDPNKFNFYEKEQPLNDFACDYMSLCYETPFTTQYNSYSDLWHFETILAEWIPLHHPKTKKW